MQKNSFRLDKFDQLPYKTRKSLLYNIQGRRVDFLFIISLSPCDLVRIIDQYGDIFVLEIISPIKRLIWLRQFPPVSEMEGWKERTNWGTCEISNYIEQGEDCRFFSGSIMGRISRPKIIRILEERGRRLPNL